MYCTCLRFHFLFLRRRATQLIEFSWGVIEAKVGYGGGCELMSLAESFPAVVEAF